MLSLAGGLPDPALLPAERIAAAAQRALADSPSRSLQYAPTEGLAELRDVIAASEGVEPERVVVTTGSQQGLDLLARVGVRPGEVVAVEQPGSLGAIQAFRSNGARLLPIAGDRDGMRTDVLAEHLAAGIRPRLVSVVTDLSNPSGSTLSDARRDHLASLAERYGFLIVEDDPYGRLRWRGPTLARLRCRTEFAASLGTVSKVIAPGLRVGWIVAPLAWRDELVVAKQSVDLHTATLDQRIAADLLADEPFLDRHLSAVRACYRARSEALVAAARSVLGDRLEVDDPDGGMFVWARVRDVDDATPVLAAALDQGMAFVPGSVFRSDDAPDPRIRLCFTTVDEPGLWEAMRRLDRAVTVAVATDAAVVVSDQQNPGNSHESWDPATAPQAQANSQIAGFRRPPQP